jgi:hypothetical protein
MKLGDVPLLTIFEKLRFRWFCAILQKRDFSGNFGCSGIRFPATPEFSLCCFALQQDLKKSSCKSVSKLLSIATKISRNFRNFEFREFWIFPSFPNFSGTSVYRADLKKTGEKNPNSKFSEVFSGGFPDRFWTKKMKIVDFHCYMRKQLALQRVFIRFPGFYKFGWRNTDFPRKFPGNFPGGRFRNFQISKFSRNFLVSSDISIHGNFPNFLVRKFTNTLHAVPEILCGWLRQAHFAYIRM